jgi:hypothetical protein
MQDVIPMRIHHGNQVVSGESWLGNCTKNLIPSESSLTCGLSVVSIF